MEQNKAKYYFWVILDVLLLGVLVAIVFFAIPALQKAGNSFVSARTITVSAEGKAIVTPDMAQSSFSVVSRGINPEQLTDSNNQKMTAVIEFLKSQGMDGKDIKTTGYNLSPDYRYDPATQRNFITGYTLTQTVTVKMRDLGKVAKIIGGLTPLGVNQIGNISFSADDPEKFLTDAKNDAFLKAQEKAVSMAKKSGTALGRVLNVGEYRATPYYGGVGLGGGAAYGVASAEKVAAPTIEPGTYEISDQVTITYELN